MFGKLVWLVTALSAINVGLSSLGYGLGTLAIMQGVPLWVVTALAYAVGLAGLLSLVMFFTSCKSCCDDAACAAKKGGSCDCNKRS